MANNTSRTVFQPTKTQSMHDYFTHFSLMEISALTDSISSNPLSKTMVISRFLQKRWAIEET